MKKIIILFAIVLMSVSVFAQSRGSVITLTPDTVNGNETIYFSLKELRAPNYSEIQVDVLCTNIGGTSDGTMEIQESLDGTNWVQINGVGAGIITASPKASITGADLNQVTITNALVASWTISTVSSTRYRLAVAGTASDSTLISPKYRFK